MARKSPEAFERNRQYMRNRRREPDYQARERDALRERMRKLRAKRKAISNGTSRSP